MLRYWVSGVAVFLTHVMSVDVTINPGCECVVYQSYGLSQGHFHSPNYPSYYARGINCILFTFIGDVNEIVELTFIEFNLKPRDPQNGCTDYLKLFLNLERPEVNENSIHSKVICGNITDLNQKTFYSRGRSLVMEFHSDSKNDKNFTGFSGRFRYLDANKFQTTGVKIIGTTCSYECSSMSNNSKGYFFSPLYPQNYPSYSSCAFKFYGRSKEKVKLVFLTVQLYNNDSRCDKRDDHIIVYDGESKQAKVKRQLCGIKNNVVVYSSGPYMYVEFHSNGQNEQKGFGASYEFIPEYYIPTSTMPSFTNCNERIVHTDSTNQNGTIQSPNFGGLYPSSVTCMYEFQGRTGERVQIKFSHMDLFHSRRDNMNSHDCKGEDSVTIYIGQPNQHKEIGTNCGQALPPQFMSNTNWMKVIFVSESQHNPDPAVTGFQFHYFFRTDFGITSGIQDKSKNCSFSFLSSEAESGNLTSPNYPGAYPIDTLCFYEFRGFRGGKVFLEFEDFDVGHDRRCDASDDSDYVSFSNFKGAVDKKMRRLCGQLHSHERTITSDGAYFSMTFRSNYVYDGKGFKAKYQFIKETKDTTTTALSQMGNNAPQQLITLTIYYVCIGLSILAGHHFMAV